VEPAGIVGRLRDVARIGAGIDERAQNRPSIRSGARARGPRPALRYERCWMSLKRVPVGSAAEASRPHGVS
jgi:hypothetical protein